MEPTRPFPSEERVTMLCLYDKCHFCIEFWCEHECHKPPREHACDEKAA